MLAGCKNPEREPSIGEAYVGPATLNLRQELAPKSPVSATVKHADHLEILATRRRFVKVRTEDDKQGWVDGYQLLTPTQMSDLRELAKRAQKLPSQGSATVYDVLNMHTEPSRQAPSFYQIQDKGEVEVMGHRIASRGMAATAPPVTAIIKATPSAAAQKKNAKAANPKKLPPPPAPAAPKPPENWLDLSRTGDPAPAAAPAQVARPVAPAKPKIPGPRPQLSEAEKAAILEDWSLVRTREGRVGWVLARPLVMNIPDEVAQYAEGHRITSYFAMGDVRDRDHDTRKTNWFWTTAQRNVVPYEFDAARIFTYNPRRRRYETAFSERNLRGYYPVEVETSGDGLYRFSLVVEVEPDKFFRKTYEFNGHSARLVARVECTPPESKGMQKTESAAPAPPQQPAQAPKNLSWYERTKAAIAQTWKRWFG